MVRRLEGLYSNLSIPVDRCVFYMELSRIQRQMDGPNGHQQSAKSLCFRCAGPPRAAHHLIIFSPQGPEIHRITFHTINPAGTERNQPIWDGSWLTFTLVYSSMDFSSGKEVGTTSSLLAYHEFLPGVLEWGFLGSKNCWFLADGELGIP